MPSGNSHGSILIRSDVLRVFLWHNSYQTLFGITMTINTKELIKAKPVYFDIDDAIALQLPKLDIVHSKICGIIKCYLDTTHDCGRPKTIIDLGSGTGKLIELMHNIDTNFTLNFISIEDDSELSSMQDSRFECNFDKVEVVMHDLTSRKCLEESLFTGLVKADVIVSSFLTSYLGQDNIYNLFKDVYTRLDEGGMFVLVDEMPTFLTTIGHIVRNSTEPNINNSYFANTEMFSGNFTMLPIEFYKSHLKQAGFKVIDCFYKDLKTTGLICLK